MNTFTPTTDQIRTEWALSNPGGSPTTIMHAEAAFDRWLAERDAKAKLEAHEGMADLLATSLRMIQAGTIGQHNVLSDEKAAGFQLAIDNITNFIRSYREEQGT